MNATKGGKALVVFSGGQDSSTCLFWALRNFDEVHTVTFSYGQRHHKEVSVARALAEKAGVDFHLVDLSFISGIGTSSLTDTAVEMDRISREHMEAAGFGKNFAYSAIHSVGVIEFEAPILSSKTDLVLSPGMVFSIDIPLFLNDWGGMRLENGYLVTENGCERLNPWRKTYIKPV